jgi:hypothetical protein
MTKVSSNTVLGNAVSGARLRIERSDGGDQPRRLPSPRTLRGENFLNQILPKLLKIEVFEKDFKKLAVDGPLSPGNSSVSHETATIR